jgi:hypothetical protein
VRLPRNEFKKTSKLGVLMLITLDIPQELGIRLNPFKQELPKLLELGLRELVKIKKPSNTQFDSLNDILEFLAKLPDAKEILALRASETLQNEMNLLLEKQHSQGLTLDEEKTWQQYEYIEHLVRIAKSNALLKLQSK